MSVWPNDPMASRDSAERQKKEHARVIEGEIKEARRRAERRLGWVLKWGVPFGVGGIVGAVTTALNMDIKVSGLIAIALVIAIRALLLRREKDEES